MGILFHTMATPEFDLTEAANLSSRLGFDGIELICQAGYQCGLDPDAAIEDARKLGLELRQLGAPVRVLSAYEKRIADHDESIREFAVRRLSRSITLAAALGATRVRVLAGEEVSADDWSGALDRLTSSLRQLAAIAGEYGVMLLVENHMDTMATSAVKTVSICEATGCDNVRILFDPANLATLGAEDFLQGFRSQRDWIAHVHVKDAIVDHGGRRSVVPGEGGGPWPALFAEIQASGYRGDFAIEYERRWLPELPAAEDALPRAMLFIERYLTEGRRAEI